ncbi:MAG: adenylate/guanylate cyclase domain-containing protein [Gaiellaceae bacterium]
MTVDPFDTGVVTVMFTDVEGSTDLTRRLGDEAARRTIENHRRIVRETLAAHDGREIDSIGDGFMLTFLSTRRAIACAVAIQKALAEHAREHPEEEVKLRIGLNVGEVLERGGHPFGAAVNATQRVGAHAKGGQIFVSEPVRHLAGTVPEVTFRDRGRFTLKGFSERWRLYEVVYAPPKEKAAPKPKPTREPAARRRRQLLLGTLGAGAVVVAVAAFLVLHGGTKTLDRVAANSVGIIEPSSGDIVGQVPVGKTPVDIAAGDGFLWVANLDGGTVSKIDPDSRREEDRVSPGGGKPRAISVGAGKVWVANGFSNTLAVLLPDGGVDHTIELAGPDDVAASLDAVWVVEGTHREVTRIDADTYEPATLAKGEAVAVGPNGVWVANGTKLTRYNPGTLKKVGPSFELRFPATQIAVGADGVAWVTHQSDDAVSRVDPESSPSAFEGVANDPTGIAVGEGSVWVASSLGRTLVQIDAESGNVERQIPLGSSPAAVVVADGLVWVTTQASA